MISFEIPPDHAANIDKLLDKIGVKDFSCSEIKASLDHHRELHARAIKDIGSLIDEFRDLTPETKLDPDIKIVEVPREPGSPDARYVYLLRKINEELSEGCFLEYHGDRLATRLIGRFKVQRNIIGEGPRPVYQIDYNRNTKTFQIEDCGLLINFIDLDGILGIQPIEGHPGEQFVKKGPFIFEHDFKSKESKRKVTRISEKDGKLIHSILFFIDLGDSFTAYFYQTSDSNQPLPNTPSFKYFSHGMQKWSLGNGTGGFDLQNDACYEGQLDSNYLPEGRGKLIQSKGTAEEITFEGDFEKGELVFGTIRYPKQQKVYHGQVLDSKPEGKGKLTEESTGISIEGVFKAGIPSGVCTVTTGHSVFEGEVEGHVLVGKQRIMKEFSPTFTGRPVPEHEAYSITREGQFNLFSLAQEGWGKEMDCFGNYYEGMFKDGKRCGQGSVTIVGHGKMQGNYTEGGLQGQGKWEFEEGGVYEGEFVDSTPHGSGAFIKNGTIMKGIFEHGKMVVLQEEKTIIDSKPTAGSGSNQTSPEEKTGKPTRGGARQFIPPGSTGNKLGCSSLPLSFPVKFRTCQSVTLPSIRWPQNKIGKSETRILIQRTARIFFK